MGKEKVSESKIKRKVDISKPFKFNKLPRGKKLKNKPPLIKRSLGYSFNGGATKSRHTWQTCSGVGCGIQTRSLRTSKEGKPLCFKCWRKQNGQHYINMPFKNKRKPLTIKQALERVYEVRGTVGKAGTVYGGITLPGVLAGRKIKLMVVEEE